MRIMPLIFLLAAIPAFAKEPVFRANWIAACKYSGTEFSVRFRSKSGDAAQDDQAVTLIWDKAKDITLPVKPALFVSASFTTDAENYCRGIGAFDWRKGRLLLLLPKNDRPSYNQVVAVIIDAKTGAFVQNAGALGSYWRHVVLLRWGRGYRVQLEKSWHVDPNNGGEFAAPGWMLLYRKQGLLVHKWSCDVTARRLTRC